MKYNLLFHVIDRLIISIRQVPVWLLHFLFLVVWNKQLEI